MYPITVVVELNDHEIYCGPASRSTVRPGDPGYKRCSMVRRKSNQFSFRPWQDTWAQMIKSAEELAAGLPDHVLIIREP